MIDPEHVVYARFVLGGVSLGYLLRVLREHYRSCGEVES